MTWRTVVIAKSAKLDYQLGFLVIRRETNTKIHLSEIHTLIIESTAVSLTSALLAELVEQKIKVIFCDDKHNPSSELVPYYGSHDTSKKVRNQIIWTPKTKETIWTEIVAEKIRKQSFVLAKYNKNEEKKLLDQYLDEMQFNDFNNREGHAAKVYFNALFGKDFSRNADNSINAALNYGYSLILSCVSREITANGYITQLGISHDNMFNQFNLACDLMEPFRPLVDLAVLGLKPDKFEHDEKVVMLKVLSSEVIINARREFVTNALKIYVKSVFDALEASDASLIRFYMNEL